MNCMEAAESVSALFDGEPLSREAAAHLSDCEECRARLNDYAEMGAELRDLASTVAPHAVPEGHWRLAEPAAANHWLKKWTGTMRIPRFAFGLMLIAIFALSGGIALVKARPGGSGPVLLVTVKHPTKRGNWASGGYCEFRTNLTGGHQHCGWGSDSGIPGYLWVRARYMRTDGDRAELAIKARYSPGSQGGNESEALADVTEQEYWLEPGRGLEVQVAGLGTIEFTGVFLPAASNWFAYEIKGRDGKMIVSGAVPPNGEGNPYYDAGAGMTYADGMVCFHVRMMERVGEAERIGVKGLWIPKGENRGFCVGLDNMQEREFLYSPGEELRIPVGGYGELGIKGHLESKLPGNLERGMYPEYGKFRIDAPVLLVRGNELLGRFNGGGGELLLSGAYFAFGQQDQGWFLFSSKPLVGAVEGTLTMNHVEFTLDGQQYSLFTGNPIVFGKINVWVKHYTSIKDADPTSLSDGWQGSEPRLAFGELQNLAAGK